MSVVKDRQALILLQGTVPSFRVLAGNWILTSCQPPVYGHVRTIRQIGSLAFKGGWKRESIADPWSREIDRAVSLFIGMGK